MRPNPIGFLSAIDAPRPCDLFVPYRISTSSYAPTNRHRSAPRSHYLLTLALHPSRHHAPHSKPQPRPTAPSPYPGASGIFRQIAKKTASIGTPAKRPRSELYRRLLRTTGLDTSIHHSTTALMPSASGIMAGSIHNVVASRKVKTTARRCHRPRPLCTRTPTQRRRETMGSGLRIHARAGTGAKGALARTLKNDVLFLLTTVMEEDGLLRRHRLRPGEPHC